MLLPVPENRTNFVGSKITQRFMEIEHYFSDQVLQAIDVKGDKVAPDSQIFTINSKKKTDFAKNKIDNLDENEFNAFNILFNIIDEIANT